MMNVMRCYSRDMTYRGVGPRETQRLGPQAALGAAANPQTPLWARHSGTPGTHNTLASLSHQGRITQHIRRTWSKHTRPQMFKHAARSAELMEL